MTPPDNPVYTYPLVMIIRDDYDPDTAIHLLRGLIGLDDESAAVSVKLAAMEAEREIERSRN